MYKEDPSSYSTLIQFFAVLREYGLHEKQCILTIPLFYLISASRLGLYACGAHTLSGEQIDQMDIHHLQRCINNVSVFYRVSPRHKHKIVRVSNKFITTLESL